MTRQECDAFIVRIVKLQAEQKMRTERHALSLLAQRLLAEYRVLYASVVDHRLSLEENRLQGTTPEVASR